MFTFRHLAFLVLCTVSLPGCGQIGPLYLPAKTPVVAPSSHPAPAASTVPIPSAASMRVPAAASVAPTAKAVSSTPPV